MELSFSKYHGFGNDFICIDFRHQNVDFVALGKQLCSRHFSIGADGLLALLSSDVADFRMLVVNADGSIPEMCGNGLRCFVAFLHHLGLTHHSNLRIETDAGILGATIGAMSGANLEVSVDMGVAHFGDQLPSKDFLLESNPDHQLMVLGQSFTFIPVSMGNPHCVMFVDNVDEVDVALIGPLIEQLSYFPNRINVEFVQVVSEHHLKMRVWERGVGETNACGTGACASVVAGVLTHRCNSRALVDVIGGGLDISFSLDTHKVQMKGPATFVFSSKITI